MADHAEERRLVLVEANWQANPLIALLQKTPALGALVELRPVQDQEERDRLLCSDGSDRRRLIGFWQQVTDFWIAERWIAPPLPDGVPMTRFPYLEGNCFWPLAGTDPRNRPEAMYPEGRYRYSDRFAAELAGRDADDDELYGAYLDTSAAGLDALDAQLTHELDIASRRDAMCDVRIAAFLAGSHAGIKLFHAPGSPTGATYEALAAGLAAGLEAALGVAAGSLVEAVRVQARGFQGIAQFQFPVHPAVAARLQLGWSSPSVPVRYGKNLWTHRQATTRAIRWVDWVP